ncbi:probable G-protein coupled receptor Mth-like 1 [Maniola jurtina]|uniref:probable G-protein coupled receptor Mth-like 1 n=1 Tax=Maniola jurtina TaxID=191418 RepID=UPI001E6888C0|nr:probable G-protein coupled receptor Mth-like 1 [Maniola jurtina]XP_045784917.1 probable G-protein coupled receptor Mth-like 1 [Maniola jurtina]XP_045784928.1 probable G-protein coupled receptor Mth-like 1 [Maniola jurtina]
MLATALLALLCARAARGEQAARPAPALVPRCCPPAHSLAPDSLRVDELRAADVAAACAPDERAWAPLVFAPARNRFLERGFVPQNWRLAYAAVPACDALRVLREHAAAYALLAHSGRLQVRGGPAALPPERFCADAEAALACAEDVGGGGVAKCCAPGHAFDGGRCAAAEARAERTMEELRRLGNGSAVRAGWPACAEGSQYAVAGALAGAALETDGALRLGAARLAAGAWCAEAVDAAEGARVLACARPAAARSARHVVYGAGLAVGAAFLAATLAAGFALPAAHHALHWRCQTHYVAALMLGDALLAATQLAGERVPPPLCRALAVCMHFLFLSAFFWLNTMCFNIWWTFRDFRPTSLERGQEACRLRVYMVYAWGGPLLLAGAAAVLDRLPAGAAPGVLRPRFAVQRCWFYGDMEILVYFFGPVGVLLLVNLALFASTTRQLTCGLWRRDEVKSTSERAALGRVCAKLVVVMGVTWGADVVSWAAGGPEYVWYATDLLNALQGVFIFLVVGCQPHAWAALKRAAHAWCARAPASSSQLPSCGESLTHTTAAPPARLPMETVC